MIKLGKTLHSKLFPLLALAALSIAPSFSNASYENSTAVGVKEEKPKIMLVNNFSYSFTTDANDTNAQKVYYQGLRYSGTLFFLDQYYATFGLGANYHTVDDTLVEEDSGAFHLSDLSVGLGSSGFTLYKGNHSKVSLFTNVSSVFPLSERSRNEGYKAIPAASVDLAYLRGPLGLVLSGQYAYVLNSYDTSLTGEPNIESSTTAGITARYNWWKLRFQYSYRFGVRRFLDGSNVGASGNSLSIIGMINKNFWAGIFTNNVNYLDEQFVDIWFYDPYVRTYNLSLGVTF